MIKKNPRELLRATNDAIADGLEWAGVPTGFVDAVARNDFRELVPPAVVEQISRLDPRKFAEMISSGAFRDQVREFAPQFGANPDAVLAAANGMTPADLGRFMRHRERGSVELKNAGLTLLVVAIVLSLAFLTLMGGTEDIRIVTEVATKVEKIQKEGHKNPGQPCTRKLQEAGWKSIGTRPVNRGLSFKEWCIPPGSEE